MSQADESYGLLSQTSGIEETRDARWRRNLSAGAGLGWLSAGWRDLKVQPGQSLAYGLGIFLISVLVIWQLAVERSGYVILPALSGFLIVAPLLGIGLYEKSRALEQGEPTNLRRMIFVKPKAGAQVFFAGLLLYLLAMLWVRAAVLIYALFFGVRPFSGLQDFLPFLITEPMGWALLLVGTSVGGLFAAFAFAISVFSIPMLLDKKVDAMTAMGTSMALVWNNLVPMISWGAIVLALFLLCAATGLLGLILVFPLLGHATWHAYRAVSRAEE